MALKSLYLILLTLFFCYGCNQHSEKVYTDDFDKLYKVEYLLKHFYNDSAKNQINELKSNIKFRPSEYYSLRLDLAEAIVVEQKQLGGQALKKVNQIIESTENKFPDLYIKSCLLAALIHEKNDNKAYSLKYLDFSENAIRTFKIDSLYPYYAIRKASWYRIFDNKDLAFTYVNDVINQTPKYNLFLEQSVGYMLKSFLWGKNNIDSSFNDSFKALEILKMIKYDRGIFNMYLNLANLNIQKADFYQAKLYSDSASNLDQKLFKSGVDKLTFDGTEYLIKSRIYKHLGKLDSALHYKDVQLNTYTQYAENLKTSSLLEMEELNRIDSEYELNRIKYLQSKKVNLLIGFLLIVMLLVSYIIFKKYKVEKKLKQIILSNNQIILHQKEELLRIDRAKSNFFANVSHELRTLLTLIYAPTDTLLAQNNYSQDQHKLLRIIQEGVRNLKKLVDQILSIEKYNYENFELKNQQFDAREYLEIVFSQFESYAQSQKKNYFYKIDIPKGNWIVMDQEKLRQIIFNILQNAFKFSSSGDTISAKMNIQNNKLNIEIVDTGQGIEETALIKLFDRNFQADDTKEGLGLGLSICKEYLDVLKGELNVKSKLGEGSTFQFSIPIDIGYNSEPATEASKIQFNTLKNYSILIVEDNSSLREYLKIILSDIYNVFCSHNGYEAFQIINKTKIDLIITDVMMPVMDGLEFIKKVKSENYLSHIPTIILSAKANETEKLEGLQLGVDDYLIKPFTEEELITRISNLLTNYQIRNDISREYSKNIIGLDELQKKWLKKFNQYLEQEFSNPHLNIDDLTNLFAMSESTLLRTSKKITGLSPQQYIIEFRLQKAQEMINKNSSITIEGIAFKVGYKDPRSFSRAYKNRFGKLPKK